MKQNFLTLFLLVGLFCKAQNDSTFFYFDRANNIDFLEKSIANENDIKAKNWLQLIYYSRNRIADSIAKYILPIKTTTNSEQQKARLDYFTGYYQSLVDNDSLSLIHYNSAYNKGLKTKDTLVILYSLTGLSQSYDYNSNLPYNKEYLDLLKQFSKQYESRKFQILHLYLQGNYNLFREKDRLAVNSFKKILNYNYTKSDSVLLPNVYNSLGVLYLENLKKPDSALIFYQKSRELLDLNPETTRPTSDFINYLNIGYSYEELNQLQNAEAFYLKADELVLNEDVLYHKSMIKENLAGLYKKLDDNKKAFKYLNEYIVLSDSLKIEEQNIAVAKYKEEFDNEKLRADNIEIEAKRKRNKVLLITSISLLLFVAIISFLIQKSTKRKQLLAEKEGEIQKQKVSTLLKDQEINSINAMIDGQEKERQRIANDLHDDLGSLMANVKFHFSALKDNKTQELFTKTDGLLDEAYDKIRSIAHAKNSGVIAKEGLLKAVINMAKKTSITSNIDIEVKHFGLENRIENSLEITIFRIIQELTANIIKHANASQAIINLTNHDYSLNIMIEDNGKGFDPKKVIKKDSMGLHSIEKRIEHIEGEITIESQDKKGTTIIIDIPL